MNDYVASKGWQIVELEAVEKFLSSIREDFSGFRIRAVADARNPFNQVEVYSADRPDCLIDVLPLKECRLVEQSDYSVDEPTKQHLLLRLRNLQSTLIRAK
ncbi:MAG: hypothetical protein KJZ79_23105 [Bryobacteraceae bacterium]|nr:hypothetical protein [Bryobacteraceae bacterium]